MGKKTITGEFGKNNPQQAANADVTKSSTHKPLGLGVNVKIPPLKAHLESPSAHPLKLK